jgi:hypothetical protein
MRRLKRTAACLLVILMSIQSTGCHSWTPLAQPLPESIEQHRGRKVRIFYQGGGAITADFASIEGSTVLAYRDNGARVDTIPLVEVKEVKLQQSKPGATAALAIAVGVGGLVAIFFGYILVCGVDGGCQ